MKSSVGAWSIIILLFAVAGTCVASIPPAEPRGFCTDYGFRGKCQYAEVFPAHTRHNPTDKPACFCYEVGPYENDAKLDARLLWKASLVDYPYVLFTWPSGGGVVAVGSYYREDFSLPGSHEVVIYDKEGRVLEDYGTKDLRPDQDLSKLQPDSQYWAPGAKYYFSADGQFFYVHSRVRPLRKKRGEPEMEAQVFRFDRSTGALDKLPISELARRKAIEVNALHYDLRFSSLTDILNPDPGTKIRTTR